MQEHEHQEVTILGSTSGIFLPIKTSSQLRLVFPVFEFCVFKIIHLVFFVLILFFPNHFCSYECPKFLKSFILFLRFICVLYVVVVYSF